MSDGRNNRNRNDQNTGRMPSSSNDGSGSNRNGGSKGRSSNGDSEDSGGSKGKFKKIKKPDGGSEDKSDGVSGFLVDLLLFLLPYVDKELFEVILGAADASAPGFDPINISEVSKIWLIIFIITPLPREMLRYIWDPLDTSKSNQGSKLNYDKTGRAKGKRTGSSGTKINLNQKIDKGNEGSLLKTAGKILGVLLVLFFIVPALFSLIGIDTPFGDYAAFVGNEIDDRTAGLATELAPVVRTYNQAKARVFCLLKGPACLRQYALNQTTRPGTRNVGETYGVKVDRFDVGQGEQLDIAYKEEDYQIPMSFTISNPRRGLKGINALDVKYRVRIIDGDNGLGNPLCDTGKEDVKRGYNINGEDGAMKNDIYPGTSASTDFLLHDKISLKKCGLLQPALGERKTVVLDIHYDYFSQSTLYFEAMSRQNFQGNPDLEKEWKESVTADTPAKAAINVNSPVLYDEETLDPEPFRFRATVNTDKRDIQYRVTGLNVVKSDETNVDDTDDSGDCSFTQVEGNEERYEPDSDAKKLFIYGPPDTTEYIEESAENLRDDERPVSYYWFSADERPPLLGCVAEIENPSEISSTGETLSMEVKSNYTVKKTQRKGGFEVYNSGCSSFNCPLLVTVQEDAAKQDYDYLNVCDGVDAGNGCTVVSPLKDSWGEFQRSTFDDGKRIEDGEIAIRVNGRKGPVYGGVDSGLWQELDGSGSFLDGSISTGIFYKNNYTLMNVSQLGEEQDELVLEDEFYDRAEIKPDPARSIVKRWCPVSNPDSSQRLGSLGSCDRYDSTEDEGDSTEQDTSECDSDYDQPRNSKC